MSNDSETSLEFQAHYNKGISPSRNDALNSKQLCEVSGLGNTMREVSDFKQ